ncbi:hypothetical protein CEXT_586541 [Caerostris extrusa]|uniref:Uncharacterized protein n=1 Tax=Caerostris extrusa TaxID=172846 RepID=A0AAV4RBJ6_CAEEX|nr:hypothetical protein CEXT_586541 [Caerostris extrusa]
MDDALIPLYMDSRFSLSSYADRSLAHTSLVAPLFPAVLRVWDDLATRLSVCKSFKVMSSSNPSSSDVNYSSRLCLKGQTIDDVFVYLFGDKIGKESSSESLSRLMTFSQASLDLFFNVSDAYLVSRRHRRLFFIFKVLLTDLLCTGLRPLPANSPAQTPCYDYSAEATQIFTGQFSAWCDPIFFPEASLIEDDAELHNQAKDAGIFVFFLRLFFCTSFFTRCPPPFSSPPRQLGIFFRCHDLTQFLPKLCQFSVLNMINFVLGCAFRPRIDEYMVLRHG